MKTWSILPFAVLGILLALLLAVSACDDDDDGDGNDWPWPTYKPAPSTAANKVRDFQCYKKTVCLYPRLLNSKAAYWSSR